VSVVWAVGTVPNSDYSGCVKCHRPHHEARGACIGCHRGNPRTDRINIAHYRLIGSQYAHFNFPKSPEVIDGHNLIEKFACRRCHQTGRKGNTLATNLDLSLKKNLPQTLADTIKNPAAYMPNFYFLETDIIKLVNAILDSGAAFESGPNESPQFIHFEESKKYNENPFVKQCGACHRVLSKQFGGLGRGNTGPNLSGLFTQFYPQNYKGKTAWNPDGLKRWLKNPRDIKVNAQMPPAFLNADEFTNILSIFFEDAL